MNPNMFKDLTDVAATLRKEYAPRLSALRQDIVKLYAARFTEQELKEMLAFYKSPIGKKLLTEEPAFVERTMTDGAGLGHQAERGSAAAFPCRNEQARPRALIARTRGGETDERFRRRPVCDRRRLGRRACGPHRGRLWRARHGGGGISRRRHLRDPRLRAEEAAGLCLAFRRRIRGCRGLWLDTSASRCSTGRR